MENLLKQLIMFESLFMSRVYVCSVIYYYYYFVIIIIIIIPSPLICARGIKQSARLHLCVC